MIKSTSRNLWCLSAGNKSTLGKKSNQLHGHLLKASSTLNLHPMTMENCHHFCYKTSLTAVLEFNNFEHNLSFYGEMAATMFMKIYQNCSTYIFNKSISQNLQLLRNNGNNIRYCWIIFTICLHHFYINNSTTKNWKSFSLFFLLYSLL